MPNKENEKYHNQRWNGKYVIARRKDGKDEITGEYYTLRNSTSFRISTGKGAQFVFPRDNWTIELLEDL